MKELVDWIFLTVMTNPIISGFILVLMLVWAFELMTGSKHRFTSWLMKVPLHIARQVLIELPLKLFKWLFSLITRKRTTAITHRQTSPVKKTKDKKSNDKETS